MNASNVNVLDLTAGGSISLVAADEGSYFMLVSASGVSFSIALSVMDLNGLRALTGDATMKRRAQS